MTMRAGYILAACIGGAVVLAVAAAVLGAVLCVRRKVRAQAAASQETPPKPSAYAPAIPQPWSAHPERSTSIPEPSGLYPTQSAEPMLPGLGSPGLSRACSTEPMLHHLSGPVSSLAPARSMEAGLPVLPVRPGRPRRARAAAGVGREPGSGPLGAPGLYQAHSAEPMLATRTNSDMSRMNSAGQLSSCSTPPIGSPSLISGKERCAMSV